MPCFTKLSLPDRAPLFKCCRRGGARKPSAKIKLHLFRHPVEAFTKQKNKTYNESFKKIHAWTKRSEATRAINDESSGSCQRISSRSKRRRKECLTNKICNWKHLKKLKSQRILSRSAQFKCNFQASTISTWLLTILTCPLWDQLPRLLRESGRTSAPLKGVVHQFSTLQPTLAIPHRITIQNMRFEQQKQIWWTIPKVIFAPPQFWVKSIERGQVAGGREGRSGYISQCNRWQAPGEEGEGGKIVFPDSFSREIQSEVNPS